MTTRKLLTAACALALGFAWTMAPAIAADESVKDKAKDKAETAKDKMGNAADKTKDKAVEIKDKTKEKAVEVKDKIKEKVSGKKNGDTVAQGSYIVPADLEGSPLIDRAPCEPPNTSRQRASSGMPKRRRAAPRSAPAMPGGIGRPVTS